MKTKNTIFSIGLATILFGLTSCGSMNNKDKDDMMGASQSSTEYTHSSSSSNEVVYLVMPGPSAIMPSKKKTPFSNNIYKTTGSYSYNVQDNTATDSKDSKDEVVSVHITFTGKDGRKYLIDQIKAAHKAKGSGEHTYFGGVGLNKEIHGNTGVGTKLEPKLMAYIALWGATDLKDANTGEVISPNRKIHIMTTTRVRDEDLNLGTNQSTDVTNHDLDKAETHVILPPKNAMGKKDPIPGVDGGFIHLMFEEVNLSK